MKKSSPELSVIVPVYNTARYLSEALDSILMQGYSNLEVIAVNDGSKDGSDRILNEYERKNDQIRVFHRENAGLSATRNFGLKHANGDYIYFFDSDDRLISGALTKLLELIRDTDSDLIGFTGRNIDESGHQQSDRRAFQKLEITEPVQGEHMLVSMLQSASYSPVVSMYIYKHSFLKDHKFKFSEGYIHEDEFFTIRALSLAESAVSLSETLFEHRIRDGSIMSDTNDIESAEGWALAVTQMLHFIKTNSLQSATKTAILKRARQLAHNTVKIIHNIEHQNLDISDFYNEDQLNQLGPRVQLRNLSPLMFKIYNKIRHILYTNQL
jgi:glycosyltransferase involved in cell wall biosynthesis